MTPAVMPAAMQIKIARPMIGGEREIGKSSADVASFART